MKKGEQLQKLRELTNRDIEHAQHGGCTDYYCDCHLELPECLDKIEWLQARNRELLEACKDWVRYMDRLDAESTPGDMLTEVRRQFHGKRVEKTRAAIAKAEGRA